MQVKHRSWLLATDTLKKGMRLMSYLRMHTLPLPSPSTPRYSLSPAPTSQRGIFLRLLA